MLKTESNSCSIFRYIGKVDRPRTVFSISSILDIFSKQKNLVETNFKHVFFEDDKEISSY